MSDQTQSLELTNKEDLVMHISEKLSTYINEQVIPNLFKFESKKLLIVNLKKYKKPSDIFLGFIRDKYGKEISYCFNHSSFKNDLDKIFSIYHPDIIYEESNDDVGIFLNILKKEILNEENVKSIYNYTENYLDDIKLNTYFKNRQILDCIDCDFPYLIINNQNIKLINIYNKSIIRPSRKNLLIIYKKHKKYRKYFNLPSKLNKLLNRVINISEYKRSFSSSHIDVYYNLRNLFCKFNNIISNVVKSKNYLEAIYNLSNFTFYEGAEFGKKSLAFFILDHFKNIEDLSDDSLDKHLIELIKQFKKDKLDKINENKKLAKYYIDRKRDEFKKSELFPSIERAIIKKTDDLGFLGEKIWSRKNQISFENLLTSNVLQSRTCTLKYFLNNILPKADNILVQTNTEENHVFFNSRSKLKNNIIPFFNSYNNILPHTIKTTEELYGTQLQIKSLVIENIFLNKENKFIFTIDNNLISFHDRDINHILSSQLIDVNVSRELECDYKNKINFIRKQLVQTPFEETKEIFLSETLFYKNVIFINYKMFEFLIINEIDGKLIPQLFEVIKLDLE